MKVTLGEVVSIASGLVDPRLPQFEYLPIINGENIESGTTRLLFRRTAGDEGLISPKYRVATGDVVYSKLRPYLRKAVVATEPGLCSADTYPLRPNDQRVDSHWLAWMLVSDRFSRYAIDASGRARMPKLNQQQLFEYEFDLPSIDQQRRTAERLDQQFARLARARHMTTDRIKVARQFGLSAITEVFSGRSAAWPSRRLADVTEGRRSPAVTSDGEIPVTTVTSGCLTPFGFAFGGLRVGRMSSFDAVDGAVASDEVLVSRSNTEALVGRAARYPGSPGTVVASDLVFRLVADPMSLIPDYLAGYLSVLQLAGYWRDRSSGASSTMKKITKALLLNVEVPLPPLAEQLRIVEHLQERMRSINALEAAVLAERHAIDALPAGLLRREFEDLAA